MKDVSKIKRYVYGALPLIFLIFSLFWALNKINGKNGETLGQKISPIQAIQAKTVTSTDTKVITLKDSDGDGLLDEDDPHPSIAEIYIVEDEDRDGIVDDFEK